MITETFKEILKICKKEDRLSGAAERIESIEAVLDDFKNGPVASHVPLMGFVCFSNKRDGGKIAHCLDDRGIYDSWSRNS